MCSPVRSVRSAARLGGAAPAPAVHAAAEWRCGVPLVVDRVSAMEHVREFIEFSVVTYPAVRREGRGMIVRPVACRCEGLGATCPFVTRCSHKGHGFA